MLVWIAAAVGTAVVGFLSAIIVPLRSGAAGRELLLYEIGVGRALVAAVRAWMAEAGASDAWVLADNDGAAAVRAACGFRAPEGMARYMTLEGA